jgi:predicted  nucleic acid-binding Zn-ribbon protein
MAIIYDRFGDVDERFLLVVPCDRCGEIFREDESDYFSLCFDCGEQEDAEEERRQAQRLKNNPQPF